MEPGGDLSGLISLLKSGGDVVLIVAAWVAWKTNERITKLEVAFETLKAGGQKP